MCGQGAQRAGGHDGLQLTLPGYPLDVSGLSESFPPQNLCCTRSSGEPGPRYWLTMIISPQGSNLRVCFPAAPPRLGAETLIILLAWLCGPTSLPLQP